MTPSFLQTAASALVVLSSIPHTTAFYNIQIADTVAAGTDVPITIVNDIADGSLSFDAGFSNYRVYLSVSAPGSGEGPSCYLVNSSAIDVADFTVQIPASVGPSGSTYAIVTMEFNADPELDGPSGFQYSDVFTLTGATGEWSEYETDPSGPYGFANPDEVPCTAYNCARECSQKYYPDNIQDQEGTAAEETWNCVAACPGVAYPTWDSLSVDDGDDGDGSDDSSSSYAAATSTSFTGSASSSIIQSSTSTPHSTSASVTSSANTRASTATSTSITSSATSSASGSSTSSSSAPSQTSSGAVDRATIPKFATIFTILVTFVAAVKF